MIRDPGPSYNIGWGVTSSNLDLDEGEKRGHNPNAGFISKRLEDHPIMRFFSASAATLVGVAVAGSVVRKGGVKLAVKLQDSGWADNALKDVRKVRDILDDWQGLQRTTAYKGQDQLFMESADGPHRVGKKLYTDGAPKTNRGFFFTQAERETALRTQSEVPAQWALKDELQQRLVSQARRLPYELPAAYMVQRGLVDPVFGTDDQKDKVNWHNPVDVMTDFVTQSVKNTAFMFSPFDLAVGGSSHSWRRLMSYGDDFTNKAPWAQNQKLAEASVSLKTVLSLVGHDAADLTQKAISYSGQVSGSFATGVKAAQENSIDLGTALHRWRHGTRAAIDQASLSSVGRRDKFNNYVDVLAKSSETNILDALPVPFRGMGSGVNAAKQRWLEIAKENDALDKLNRMGKARFEKNASPEMIKAAQRGFKGSGTAIEDFVDKMESLGNGGPLMANGRRNKRWQESEFYKGQLEGFYKRRFLDNLSKQGIGAEEYNRVSKLMEVTPALQRGNQGATQHETNRIRVGGRKLAAENTPDFWNEVLNKLHISDPTSRAAVGKALPKALERTDQLFQKRQYKQAVDRIITREWDTLTNQAIPRAAEQIIGKGRLPYETFTGTLNDRKKQFLRRQFAESTGLSMTDRHGRKVSDAIVHSHIKDAGFSADNYDVMRAYLVTQGKVSKPWTMGGRNAFGMKTLSVNEGISRGIFGNDRDKAAVTRLVGQMQARDPIGDIGEYQIKGVFETAGGSTFNAARVGRSMRNFVDRLADDVQIPLIHTSPFDLFNYNLRRQMRQSSVLQYVPAASSRQPFLAGTASEDAFYLWMRSGGRGTKGTVNAVSYKQGTGQLIERQLDGHYRPFGTQGNSMHARHVRLAYGDMGLLTPSDASLESNTRIAKVLGLGDTAKGAERLSRLKSGFNVNPDQPDSIFRYFDRFANRKTDINNPVVFARLMRGESIEGPNGPMQLDVGRGGVVNAAGDFVPGYGPKEVASALQDLTSTLKIQGMSSKVVGPNGISEFQNLLQYTFKHTSGNLLGDGPLNINDAKSTAQMVEFAQRLVTEETSSISSSFNKQAQPQMRRALDALVNRHLRQAGSDEYWDSVIPGSNRYASISTRLDQLRSDVQKYLIIRNSTTGTGGVPPKVSFAQRINEALRQVDELKQQGRIAAGEYTETRAAILGLQADFASISTYKPDQASLPHMKEMLGTLLGGDMAPGVRSILGDVASGHVNKMPGKFGVLQPMLRRRFGNAQYEAPGTQYNPFGGNIAFVPTAGTVWRRGPKSAAASVAGLNTWSNPQAFSGMSIPTAHMFERLNRYADIVGLSLDPTKYKGPLDMYARGLVGQRALPLVAGFAGLTTADRVIGGMVNPRDEQGERVYSPFFIGKAARGVVELQSAAAAAIPGGMGYQEKKQQLLEGEVPIKAGRWWPLGNTPFEGGRTKYYRPSWYRRMKSGHQYTDDFYGTPIERLAFGYDFSPLRPFSPYHYESKHYFDRPYPVTGEYFTGPWGPLTSALNLTAGKLLKPQLQMHDQALREGLGTYASVGQAGAYQVPAGTSVTEGFSGAFNEAGFTGVSGIGIGTGSSPSASFTGGGAGVGFGFGSGGSSVGVASQAMSDGNARLARFGGLSPSTGAQIAAGTITGINRQYMDAAMSPSYGIASPGTGMDPRIIAGTSPIAPSSMQYQLGKFGYELQELAGIYGFGFASARESLGLGSRDFANKPPVLQSASTAFGSTRGFWDLNLGGMGDVPTPLEGNFANLEFSEIVRRFVPRERTDIDYINPIANTMGQKYPWLPGPQSRYFLNFHQGDPYTEVEEGELRLPGIAYERLNGLHSDSYGKYGLVDIHKILGDVAPWSAEYRAVNRLVDQQNMPQEWRERVEMTREQVQDKSVKNKFSDYRYKYSSPEEMGISTQRYMMGRIAETLGHRDTYLNTKLSPNRTAVEDWERNHVYGATFPQWQDPIASYIEPMLFKATQRNPVAASLSMGAIGTLFSRTPVGKAVGSIVGGTMGLTASLFGKGYEASTGQRYMPTERKKQAALEEYADMLSYVKYTQLASMASNEGDTRTASEFRKQAAQTMYGADIYGGDINSLAMAIPKRKREHFKAMIMAPEQERERILSTAPRLERRLYQAAWGMRVEKRPELDDYFQNHELPSPEWEGWHPNTNMEHVKIKMGQSMGLDMSQMGYYGQQEKEANYVNPSYPDFSGSTNRFSVETQLRQLMQQQGVQGDVTPIFTPYPGTRVQINAGVF